MSYAVFHYEGDDIEQDSNWMSYSSAFHYIEEKKKHYVDRHYIILEKVYPNKEEK